MADETLDHSLKPATTNIAVLLKEWKGQENLNHKHHTSFERVLLTTAWPQ